MNASGGGMWDQLPEDFRERLAEAARRARQAAPPHPEEEPDTGIPPCRDVETPFGPSLVRDLTIAPGESGLEETFGKLRSLEDLLDRQENLAEDLTPLGRSGMKRVVFLDLETTGFSSTPLFLAGTMTLEGGRLRLRQFFAKDYSQEKSLLHRLAEFLADYDLLVSFNGKSYDVPFSRSSLRAAGGPPGPLAPGAPPVATRISELPAGDSGMASLRPAALRGYPGVGDSGDLPRVRAEGTLGADEEGIPPQRAGSGDAGGAAVRGYGDALA
jgi:hypothetical protein